MNLLRNRKRREDMVFEHSPWRISTARQNLIIGPD